MAAAKTHDFIPPKESSVVSLLSGWAQQGVQTFFSTQRILLDLVMRQNASIMRAVKERLSDPHHSPAAILSEIAGEGMATFLEGQKVLLDLGKQQNEILMTGLDQRIGDCPRRHAMINLLRRSVETFIHTQEQYLQTVGKQTHAWAQEAKAGRPYHPEHLVTMAREGMDTFIKAQKQYLDVVAQETAKMTSSKRTSGATRKTKPAELAALAQKATESFIEAQKRLVDVAGHQLHANVTAAGKTMELLKPFPLLPLNELTKEVVKSYVDAQRALMGMVAKVPGIPVDRRARKPARRVKVAAAVA